MSRVAECGSASAALGGKKKLLRYYPDKQNCDYSDDVMLAHCKPPSLTTTLYTMESITM